MKNKKSIREGSGVWFKVEMVGGPSLGFPPFYFGSHLH